MVKDMAIPEGWRGSDGRSRSEVVQYLRQHGDEVTDKSGLTVTHMREALGKGRAITQLLADMEADGMISREVRGRRTFRITLVDDKGFADAQTRHLRSAPEPANDEQLLDSNVDLTLLAESLLAIVVKKASQPAAPATADTQGLRQLTARLRSAETALDKATKQLRDRSEELTATTARLSDLEEQNRALENNLALMQRELTRKPKGRGTDSGVPLIDRLDEEGRATLRTLMSQLPETPTSRPRKSTQVHKRG